MREGETRLADDPWSDPAVMDEPLEERRSQLGAVRALYRFGSAILWQEPVYPMRPCSTEQAALNRLPLPRTAEPCCERSRDDNSAWQVRCRRPLPMGKSRSCRSKSVQRV